MDYKITIEKEKKEKPLYDKVSGEKLDKVIKHNHDGINAEKVKPKDLSQSFIKTVAIEPTEAPTRYIDNIQLLPNGVNSILYVWDNDSKVWLKFNFYLAP